MIRHLVFLHQRIREAFLQHAYADIEDVRLRRLARAIASLPDRQHEVFRLARFDNLTTYGIAQRLGISEAEARAEFVIALTLVTASVERQRRKGW